MTSCSAMARAREVSLTRVMISLDMGGTMRLTIWSRVTLKKICRLVMPSTRPASFCPAGTPLDAAPVDLGKIEGVVDDEGHAYRRHPSHLAPGPWAAILQYQTGHIKQGDDLQDQGRAPDNPDQQTGDQADGAEGNERRATRPGSCPGGAGPTGWAGTGASSGSWSRRR